MFSELFPTDCMLRNHSLKWTVYQHLSNAKLCKSNIVEFVLYRTHKSETSECHVDFSLSVNLPLPMTFLSTPAPEDPMLKRPELRMFIAILNPPPTSPITFSAGTGVLSKYTSQAKITNKRGVEHPIKILWLGCILRHCNFFVLVDLWPGSQSQGGVPCFLT